MLETLSRGFRSAKEFLLGVATLTEDNIEKALREVRLSLLEADVALPVTKLFLNRVKEKALGLEVQLRAQASVESGKHTKESKSVKVSPAEHFVRICHEELISLMGPTNTEINWAKKGPTVIMMLGLQGVGKTTTVGKLAQYLKKIHNKRPLLVAADIYRPAAITQLEVLGQKLDTPVYSAPGKTAAQIAEEGYKYAYTHSHDVVIVDTAGRLAIDDLLMQELEEVKAAVRPQEIFLVCDAMIGQDAVHTAKIFHDRLATTGFILTKLDGDARGGAALSIKEVTGQPIKFLGIGEHLDKLEEFRPEGLASRILGMGDVVGLMKDFEQVVDAQKAEEDAKRMLQGQFDMQDFLEQIRVLQKMGSLKDLIDRLPLGDSLPSGFQVDYRDLVKIESMIFSMTRVERKKPELFLSVSMEQFLKSVQSQGKAKLSFFVASRLQRVAQGSGHTVQEVADLLQRFSMMKQMMSALGRNSGLLGKIPGLKNIARARDMMNMDFSQFGLGGMGPSFSAGIDRRIPPIQTFKSSADRNKEKRKRKAAKDARKQNKRKKR